MRHVIWETNRDEEVESAAFSSVFYDIWGQKGQVEWAVGKEKRRSSQPAYPATETKTASPTPSLAL